MPDITTLYDEEDAAPWNNYVVGILDSNEAVKISCDSKDLRSFSGNFQNVCNESQVISVILSPSMLETLATKYKQYASALDRHRYVAVILCFTEEEEFEQHIKPMYQNSNQWKILKLHESSIEENKTMVSNIVELLEDARNPPKTPLPLPKPKQRAKDLPVQTVCPDCVRKKGEKILIVFKDEVHGTVQVAFKKGQKIDTKKLNPYTYKFSAPERKLGRIKLGIFVDGKHVQDYPIMYESPVLSSYLCPEFLAQSLDVEPGDTHALDQKLTRLYEESLPMDSSLERFIKPSVLQPTSCRSEHKLPTLLHFAASHGLSDLCAIILDTPGSFASYRVLNSNGKDPGQLAEDEGHQQLADYLRMFIETQTALHTCDEYYEKMTGTSLYTNDGNKPSEPEGYMSMASGQGVKQESGYAVGGVGTVRQDPDDGYAKGKVHPQLAPIYEDISGGTKQGQDIQDRPPQPMPRPYERRPSPSEFIGISGGTEKEKDSCQLQRGMGSRTLNELADIQQRYKQGEFNLNEVEMLYSSWKERYPQQTSSMRERQQQLEELRNRHKDLIDNAVTKKGIFGTLRSLGGKQKTSKTMELEIQGPTKPGNDYSTFRSRPTPARTSERLSTASTVSSSSSSSRSSRDSGTASSPYSLGSDSDDQEDYENVGEQLRRGSNASQHSEHRRSLRQDFMQGSKSTKSVLPTPPPRIRPKPQSGPPPTPKKPSR